MLALTNCQTCLKGLRLWLQKKTFDWSVIQQQDNVWSDSISLPGTSEKERKDSNYRKRERRIFKFPNQTQNQETGFLKERQPSRKVQVCWFNHVMSYSVKCGALFLLISLSFFFTPQFSGAAICHTPGEQTTQELHITCQHPKDKTNAETQMWVSKMFVNVVTLYFTSVSTCLWHVCCHSRWKDGRRASLLFRQIIVQWLRAGAGPQQWLWGREGVCGSRVGCANFQKQHP